MHRPLLAALLVAAPVLVDAQQSADPHAAHASAVAPMRGGRAGGTVVVTATDYAFQAPDTVDAGYTTFRLLNRGTELHHVQVVRLDEGKSLADLFAVMKPHAPPPKWMVEIGGPNSPVPGGESVTAASLAPGRYAMLCFIPSPDGTPHIMKGMAKEFVVVPARRASPAATAKAPDNTIVLTDYAFDVARPFATGRQVIRVVNRAEQPHEVFFARLAPGKRAMDLVRWVETMEGPPPAMPLGGTSGIAKDGWNDVTLTLEPGEYAMLCFLPDAKDGKMHVMHGMTAEFTVGARPGTAKPSGPHGHQH